MADDDRHSALRTMKTFSGSSHPPAALRVTHAVLTLLSGPEAGRVVRLSTTKPNTLGRADECTVPLADARLSRVHATIKHVGGTWMLTDQGSTNGTFVNGSRVEKYSAIDDGMRIDLAGAVSCRFTFVTEEEARALTRVYDAAMHDALTGIFNRKALDERLAAEVAFAVRHVAHLTVVLLDVDDFKSINDTHGHLAGDAALREVAARLVRAVRTEDVVARYGGEEFLVIARDTGLEQGAQLAERLRKVICAETIPFESQSLALSASFGVASIGCCRDQKDVHALLGIADARLYAAKRTGRNRVVARDEKP
jgi:diguanylate cyclase (GGDEF)-like protein